MMFFEWQVGDARWATLCEKHTAENSHALFRLTKLFWLRANDSNDTML